MHYRSTLLTVAAILGLGVIPRPATAGVVNVVPNQTVPNTVTGLRYKIHVDDIDVVDQHKIVFGAIRFHNADGCPPGGCRFFQLETTLTSWMLTYDDTGCVVWPEDGEPGLGTSLDVNIIDYDQPRSGAVGIRQLDAATTDMFPRQNAGIDGINGLTRITSWSQVDVTDKTIEVELTRGELMDVPAGAHVTGWGHRFEAQPPGGYTGPAGCVAELPSGVTYRLWNLSITFDGETYHWEVALPAAEAAHVRPTPLLEFGTEFFEHTDGVFSARYFDFAYESGGSWTPLTQFRVSHREENADVCSDPDILTSYGWGVRKKAIGSSCAFQFANDGVNNYLALNDAFVLDGACTELPASDPPMEDPPPPLPTGTNIAHNRPTTQSSTLDAFQSGRAVDGVRNCSGADTFSHTEQNDRAWWEVDLQSVQLVSRVVLYNRVDCCQARLQNYDVLLSQTPFPAAPVNPNDYVSLYEQNPFKRFKVLYPSARARYVRVQLRHPNDYLHLAEVEVYNDCQNGQTEAWEDCDGGTCCTDCKFALSGTACEDGNLCTGGDTCAGNGSQTCNAGAAVSCDDGNVCTSDSCVPATGCSHTNTNNIPCSDGNACTIYDTCWNGVCTAVMPKDCKDSAPCTVDRCLSDGTCSSIPNVCPGSHQCGDGQVDAGEQCDDGNRIAGDCCSPTCTFEAAGTVCLNDANPCTAETCNGQGVCVPSSSCRVGFSCEGICGLQNISCQVAPSGACGCAAQ